MLHQKIYIVYVNYNDKEDILRSVKAFVTYPKISGIIIVDNGSIDGSLEEIRKLVRKNKKIYLIENGKNYGFGKAANMGIKKALALGADWVAPLNPDLVFKPDFLTKLISNGSDLVQASLKFRRDGKWVYDFGGKINMMLGRTYHLETNSPKNPFGKIDADYVSGGATVVRREVYEKIGYFDEGYFMYYEDVDFSFRAKNAGFNLAVDHNVIIEHKLEIHKVTKNIPKLKHNFLSNFKFITTWVPWYFKPVAYCYWLVLVVKCLTSLY